MISAQIGMKIHSRVSAGGYYTPPGIIVLGEPRHSYVVSAPRGGEIVEVSHGVSDLVAADEVLVRIRETGVLSSVVIASSKIKGYVAGLFVRVGMTVKQDDPVAWIAAAWLGKVSVHIGGQ